MSNEDKNELQEVVQKVVITPEDCAGAAEFWTQFEVPMPVELKEAFEAFAANPTLENQTNVKLQITKAVAYTKHEAFEDEMFKEIVAECQDVVFDLTFDKDLEANLSKEGEEGN
jgi:hypothetical protein